MDCPTCHRSFAEPLHFCLGCGTPLEHPHAPEPLPARLLEPHECPACHRANAPISRFCTACGALLPDALLHAGPEGSIPLDSSDERRTVTVLHADLCGFTRLAERLNPEQTKTLIDALFTVFAREIMAAGGRIDAYIGDAVLAVFGVPISHGDDPRRAVEAALGLHRVLGGFSHPLLAQLTEKLQVRIGIDTGPVVVGRIGSIRRTTVTGATVAAAMELERAAPAGGTLIGETTGRLLPEGYSLWSRPLMSGRAAFLVVPEEAGRVAESEARAPGLQDPSERHADAFTALPGFTTPATRAETRPPAAPGDIQLPALQGDTRLPAPQPESRIPATQGEIPLPASQPESRTPARQGETRMPGPENQRDMVQARIDCLPFEEKRLLKTAAVAGTSFWQELLERLGAHEPARDLASLAARGLIELSPRSSIPGALEYRFTSDLVREVAYQNNLIKVRRFTHRVVAAWLSERVAGDLEFVPLLAYHHTAGGDVVAAAEVLIAAAQRLTGLQIMDEAIARYREALAQLEAVGVDSPEVARLIERCRDAVGMLAPMGGETS